MTDRWEMQTLQRHSKQMKENDWKLSTAKRIESVKCECGCRVHYSKFNDRGWTVCTNCQKKIMKPKDEFKNKLKNMLKGN